MEITDAMLERAENLARIEESKHKIIEAHLAIQEKKRYKESIKLELLKH